MTPFRYDRYENPYAPTIGQMLLHRGDPEAHAAETIGAAQARAQEIAGQAWSGAAERIGQTVAQIPAQMVAAKRLAQQDAMNAIRLRGAQRREAGGQAVAGMMTGDMLPPGDVGPRQESYLDANGLFDVAKITARLGQSGFGDLAPDLVKGAESINDSILKHQKLEQETAQAHSILIGDLADGALKMHAIGTPLLEAMDFVAQPALATKRITPKDYAQVRQQVGQLPPDQQPMALKALMDQAERIAPTTKLGDNDAVVGRYGRTMASNKVPEKPTEASIALAAAKGDPTAAMGLLKPKPPTPKRTSDEQELDAYAASIGKSDAAALTYADRQTFEKNKVALRSDAAFQQHIRERNYDNANPAPLKEPDQNKIEQEYRTVLARGLSSRSGGLGLEDAKVQQANHLIALLDQGYDPKTGDYNIPKVMQVELALGLARLVSPTGTVGVQMEKELNQRTAKGDLGGALTYVLGTPFNGSTQDVYKMFKDSIRRQGEVAQQNREGEMAYLRGLAPTTLAEDRRKALEATSLNPLRLSRIIQNDKTGERKLQVSIDGGKTWQ